MTDMEIISRKDAKAQGLKRYYTGEPCIKGHICERRVANFGCTQCQKEERKKRYNNNLEQERKHAREKARRPEVKAQNKKNKQKPEYKAKQSLYAKSKAIYYNVNKQNFKVCPSLSDKERKREYARKYYHHNKEKIKGYEEKRKEAIREYKNKWQFEYRRTPKGAAIEFMRKCLYRCMDKKKKDRTYKILGYTPNQLVKHIESQFEEGMSWENHGEWHIDHIKPVDAFLNEGINCPKTINALENLQPLWAEENLSKGSNYDSQSR